jgi:hypothetical protein
MGTGTGLGATLGSSKSTGTTAPPEDDDGLLVVDVVLVMVVAGRTLSSALIEFESLMLLKVDASSSGCDAEDTILISALFGCTFMSGSTCTVVGMLCACLVLCSIWTSLSLPTIEWLLKYASHQNFKAANESLLCFVGVSGAAFSALVGSQ